jgi:hypothetical protein
VFSFENSRNKSFAQVWTPRAAQKSVTLKLLKPCLLSAKKEIKGKIYSGKK